MTGNTEHGGGWHGGRWRIAVWAAAALILLLPLVAMQITDAVNWGPFDFALAGALVVGTGLAFELAVRTSRNWAYRLGAGAALVGAFLLVWITLAVGIIGSEDELGNLLYWGVLAIGIIGAILAHFRPEGMARALAAAAGAQVLIGVIALAAGWGATSARWPLDIVGLTLFFAALFGGSALLFRRAAQKQPPAGAGRAG
jgi:hypothetical protein